MNEPALRFSKFTGREDNFKFSRLGFVDVFDFSSGKNIKQDEASPEFSTPCVRYGELYHMYEEVIHEVINRTNLPIEELLLSVGDEILLPSAGEDPWDIASASALTVSDVAIGRTINILRPKCVGICSQVFAAYYINAVLRKKIATLARGASISNVYNSDLKKLFINLPSILEQKKIAAFLGLVDAKITALRDRQAGLERYKRGLMQALFSQRLRFTKPDGTAFPDWEEKRLGEVVRAIESGMTFDQNLERNGVQVTRIETISSATINLEKVGYVQTDADISQYRLEEGDMLFSNINSVKHIGKIALVGNHEALYHGMNLLRVRPNSSQVLSGYLYYKLTSIPMKRHFERVCNQAVSQASINQTELKKTKIAIPHPDEQAKIAEALSAMDAKITAVTKQLDRMQAFKKGLLQQMFV